MSDRNISILGRKIVPGESARIELEVARLHTRNRIQIPINIERSEEEGPVLLLIAGIHGDETNGVAIVREIIKSGFHRPVKGTIISIPVFNVFGFLNQTRELPDGKDLNRVFPGSAEGSLASQFAYHFYKEVAPLVDHVIDFHTGSSDRNNITQVRCNLELPGMLELAMSFGAPFVIHSPGIPKSLRDTLTKSGKKVLLFEGGKTRSIDQEVIEQGVRGTVNTMKYLSMQEGPPEISHPSTLLRKTKWLRAPTSGLFFPEDVNGKWVSRRSLLGTIKDPYGDYEKAVRAPHACHIICTNTAPIVNRGDAIFHLSIEE
jgi:predicted deacylase